MAQYDSGTSSSGTIDSLKKLESTPQGRRDRWNEEITFAEKELNKFHEQGRKVLKKYLDDRDATETAAKWFNIFYTNVGIMEASLYANIPTADVSRKFLDMNDDVARVAGNILQRCIQQDMQEPECDFDQVMRHCVSDRLIPGLATAWLRLETETKEQEALEDGTVPADEEGNPLEVISDQDIAIDYVYWEDFLWSPCRVWSERRWVARKVPMTRDALVKRFGEDVGKKIPLDYTSKENLTADKMTPKNVIMKRACIYEIWDRETKQVIWFSKGVEELLDIKDDPLKLAEHFEPCPKPLFANTTTSNCRPKPDYAMLQDQYSELDETNNRISLLIIACKVVGVYDRGADGVQRMLTEGYDNILIPVDNWAMFAEKGGIKGQVDWLPLDVVVQALGQLQVHREAVKAQIYELTGINDVVRGNTKASETLGAQELKSKYASVRIQKLQDEITRFAEEILQIKAEILCKHFEPMILARMANAENMVPEDQALVPAALQLLKGNEEVMEWRVTIQSDAMAMIDYTQQKTERTEFLNAVATFLQSAATVGQNAPDLIPMMGSLLKFGVAGFRVGKDVEGVIDSAIKKVEEKQEAAKQAPPPPDPAMMKAEADIKAKQADAQIKQQMAQQDAQMKREAQQQEFQMKQLDFMQEMRQSQMKFEQELQQMAQEFRVKLIQLQEEGQIKRDVAAAEGAAKAEKIANQPEGSE
jgi:hypothetical protein